MAAVAAIAYPVAISARGIAIMLKFAAGLVLGLTLGAAVAAFATDEIEDGYLAGWVVTMNRQNDMRGSLCVCIVQDDRVPVRRP